ncbi:MAG TPA: zinc-ribbon domain-containing protein, partial [Methylomirabilota bacterium]|nr:zinc-ribbon domain-containing protein [Methylomirabilota bacterium]
MQCPSCQAENPPTQKFCGECGATLGAPAQPAAAAPPPAPAPAAEEETAAPSSPGPSAAFRDAAPVTYTPKHLVEKILTSKSAMEG